MNSVSTATKRSCRKRSQAASRSAVEVISRGGGRSGRRGFAILQLYTGVDGRPEGAPTGQDTGGDHPGSMCLLQGREEAATAAAHRGCSCPTVAYAAQWPLWTETSAVNVATMLPYARATGRI